MAFAALDIPGLAGTLSTEYSFWKGYRFSVAGQQVRPHGFPRNRLTLPGSHGPLEATVKGGPVRAHPILVVDGTEYPTGPPTPTSQQVLALLPLALLLLVQGAVGAGVALGAVSANMAVVRAEKSPAAKVGLMLAVLVVAAATDIVLATAVQSLIGT